MIHTNHSNCSLSNKYSAERKFQCISVFNDKNVIVRHTSVHIYDESSHDCCCYFSGGCYVVLCIYQGFLTHLNGILPLSSTVKSIRWIEFVTTRHRSISWNESIQNLNNFCQPQKRQLWKKRKCGSLHTFWQQNRKLSLKYIVKLKVFLPGL